MQIEFFKGADRGDGHQKIAATKAHRCLNASFFMSPFDSRLAKMALEQVVRAEGDERAMFPASFALEHQPDSSREIIVTDAPGHPSKVLEGADVAKETGFLLLAGNSQHEATATKR